MNKNLDFVKSIIEAGSNINMKDKEGNSALHISIYSKDINICKEILPNYWAYPNTVQLFFYKFKPEQVKDKEINPSDIKQGQWIKLLQLFQLRGVAQGLVTRFQNSF